LFDRSQRLRAAMLVLVLGLALVLTGCSEQEAPFVDGGATYDKTSVMKLAEGVDTAKLAATPSSEATYLRHKALTSLRTRGERAVPVADMLTKTFSAETRGVPVYFERATFDNKPAVIMIEAAGPANGKLIAKRVWVLDEAGNVLFVGGR
jgi:hypothetical protein